MVSKILRKYLHFSGLQEALIAKDKRNKHTNYVSGM